MNIRKSILRVPVALWWMWVMGCSGAVAATATPTPHVQILTKVPSTYVYPVDGHIPFNIHKGTPTLLALMLPGSTFDDPQGVACSLLKSTDDPKDPLDDVEITVLGVNSGAGEIFYNVGLRTLKKLGHTGRGVEQFQNPMGVALHPSGAAAVADTGNHRVVLLKHDGYRLRWVQALGGPGTTLGNFRDPSGVAYDSRGELYVADTGNNRVQVRDVRGVWRVLTLDGLDHPTALAVIDRDEPWTFFTTAPYADRLAVIDRQGTRLLTYGLDGTSLARVESPSAGPDAFHFTACAFDYYGHVVATDDVHGCLRKFDRDLKPLATFGSFGDQDYQFHSPRGICISKQLGQMIVSETSSAQYLWVGADALTLKASPGAEAVTFSFFLTEPAYLTADVRGADGTRLARVADNIQMDERSRALVWTPGAGVKRGTYTLVMDVMATYSSRDRLAKEITLPFDYDPAAPPASLEVPLARNTPTLGDAMTPTAAVGRTLGDQLKAEREKNQYLFPPTPTFPPTRLPFPETP